MFKKKHNRALAVPVSGTRESVDSSLSASSSENLSGGKEMKETVDMILKQRVLFNLYYLGKVENVNLTSHKKRDTEAQLIDQVEEAQEVFQRHPLHTIAQLIHYSDGFSKQNIAVKTGQDGRIGNQCYQCYIYQCHTEEEADSICKCVGRLFDAITAKP